MGTDKIFTEFPTGSKHKRQIWQKRHAICLLTLGKSEYLSHFQMVCKNPKQVLIYLL